MSMTSKNEWLREMSNLQRRMNQLFEGMLQPDQAPQALPEYNWTPPADVYEDDRNFYVELELPGVQIEEVEVTCEGSLLRIRGQRKPLVELTRESVQRIERYFGPFFREFTFPEPLDTENITANLKAGVLMLTIPRAEQRLSIQVK
jgi:HSP20 family protein